MLDNFIRGDLGRARVRINTYALCTPDKYDDL